MAGVNENGNLDTPLFDPHILTQLDISKFKAEYKNGITPLKPGKDLHIRPLCPGDHDKGYLDLLRQLTTVGDVSREDFFNRFHKMKACADSYYIIVIENVETGQIVGSATLVKEQKFIHHASSRGRIEDVIVSDLYRGQQLGKILIDILLCLSQHLKCYKVSLECTDDNLKFYTKFGLEKTPGQNFMQHRFYD
jgi:glucosamine-phosphate N-acetyltransferase